MLLTRHAAVERLLGAAWARSAYVPNRLGAEQSALRHQVGPAPLTSRLGPHQPPALGPS